MSQAAAAQAHAFKKLSVIIPAYNEEATLQEVIQRVQEVSLDGLEKEIIVVDDGPTDRTREILRQRDGIKAVFHEQNLGKGGAIRTGMACSTGDVLIIQDADLEYHPEDYPQLLAPILKGQCEFVMGSRFLRAKPRFFTKNGAPFFSHYLGNHIIIGLTNLLFGRKHTDYEGCYKVFTKRLADSLPVSANGFEFDNELICKCFRRGYRVVEVPIAHQPRLYSEGKKITWRDGLIMLWTIVKWRFKSF